MLKSTLHKLVETMSDDELMDSVEWFLCAGNNSPSGRKYLLKTLSYNKPVIDAVINELRGRNEKLTEGIKGMVFNA